MEEKERNVRTYKVKIKEEDKEIERATIDLEELYALTETLELNTSNVYELYFLVKEELRINLTEYYKQNKKEIDTEEEE